MVFAVFLAVCLVTGVVSSSFEGLLDLTVSKPWITNLTFVDSGLKVEACRFNYNYLTDLYVSAMVTVKNYADESLNGTVNVMLYAGSTLLANGSTVIVNLLPLAASIETVSLLWLSGNVSLVDSGRVVVS